MPFIKRQNIDAELRNAATKSFKEMLRTALLNPALTAEQRTTIREELTMLENGGRVYDANRPPRPGAISFDE